MDSNNVKLSKLLFEYVDNVDEFIKKLNSFSNINFTHDDEARDSFYDYIRDNCKHIGSGSERSVFEINDDLVIKVSSGVVGQNKNEIKISNCTGGSNPILPKIFAHDQKNFRWIIAEKALYSFEKKESELKSLLAKLLYYKDIEFEIFQYARMILYALLGGKTPYTEELESIMSNPKKTKWLENFIELGKYCNFVTNDLTSGNFGLMKDGRLAIIDYGFGVRKFF